MMQYAKFHPAQILSSQSPSEQKSLPDLLTHHVPFSLLVPLRLAAFLSQLKFINHQVGRSHRVVLFLIDLYPSFRFLE